MESMKKTYLIILVMLLSACASNSAPTAIPTVILSSGSEGTAVPVSNNGSGGGTVTASAVLVPVHEAHLAFVAGGNVMKVNAKVGDRVTTGYILVELDNTLTQLEVERAERTLRELTSPSATAAAEEALALAQKNLDDAETKVEGLKYRRASDELIDNVKAEIDLAKKQLTIASDTYRHFADRPDGDARKAEALFAMTNAQLNLNALQAKYNWYTGKPSENDVALTQAKLSIAQAAHNEAGWYLSALKGEAIPPEASGVKLAQLQQAQADVKAAHARFDQTRLVAPFDGIIGIMGVTAGEFVSPGQVLVTLTADTLQVKTTDLSERDISWVKIGDSASIRVEAVNDEFKGQVVNISPVANTLGGDVVYEVTVSLLEQSMGLLGGMSAEVTIGK